MLICTLLVNEFQRMLKGKVVVIVLLKLQLFKKHFWSLYDTELTFEQTWIPINIVSMKIVWILAAIYSDKIC